MVMKTPKGQGAEYLPSNPPQTGDVTALKSWIVGELAAIADAISEGRSRWLRLDVLSVAPSRPIGGMICYFTADAVTAGSLAGVYEYDGSTWNKL